MNLPSPFVTAIIVASSVWRFEPTEGTGFAPRDPAPGDSIRIVAEEADRAILPALSDDLARAKTLVEHFFRQPYPEDITVRVFPNRNSLTAFWREAWKSPDFEPACWMVASGTASLLTLLSPRAWKAEACEHDPADSVATFQIIAHELVHVFHGQHNPRKELEDLDEIGWFVEGVATYASGQLDRSHRGRLREAVERHQIPGRLADVWTGPYRYALAGSLVEYVDQTYGRKRVTAMLGCTSQAEILALLQTSEDVLIAGWKRVCGVGTP